MSRRLSTSSLLALTALALMGVEARAQDNPHGNADLDCATCHVEASWRITGRPAGFDHGTTGFPLTGRHKDVQCRACHGDLVFSHVGTSCVDCHADAHRGRLGPDCAHCHATTGFIDRERMRRLHDGTSMPLVGVHERVDCEACHRGAPGDDYVGTPTDCYTCHADVYAATTAPAHASAGFGTDCRVCHGVFATSWGSRDFHHPSSFPLSGGHAGVECARCHTSGFAGTPTDCYACHRTDYEQTTDPAHVAAGFATSCTNCHTINAWQPATFDHDATAFPLTGAHRTTECASCHTSGYTGTPTGCYACHQTDFQQTNDPPHTASNFPTTCATCHTTTAWQPANWDHDTLFPIYSGRHRNEWNVCADCHVVATDYTVFECIFCHEHNQTDTDRDHREVNNYQYVSTACYQCHPRGQGD